MSPDPLGWWRETGDGGPGGDGHDGDDGHGGDQPGADPGAPAPGSGPGPASPPAPVAAPPAPAAPAVSPTAAAPAAEAPTAAGTPTWGTAPSPQRRPADHPGTLFRAPVPRPAGTSPPPVVRREGRISGAGFAVAAIFVAVIGVIALLNSTSDRAQVPSTTQETT